MEFEHKDSSKNNDRYLEYKIIEILKKKNCWGKDTDGVSWWEKSATQDRG